MKKFALLLTFIALVAVHVVCAQSKTVSGTVTSASDGSTLPGVSIVVKGTTIGTITDTNGKFSFTIPSEAKTLQISYIGMQRMEVEITGSYLDVVLKPTAVDVDEVIVTAYGTRKKESLTGSVQSVDNDRLEKVTVGNFENALQGTVAGVSVINSSGMPGSAASIRIRGVGSISASSDPLYIMDGIQVTGSEFSSLNPGDIENISVLKDASATALYGSRGANGVIIITTKKGGDFEKAKITYRGLYGVTQVAQNKFNQMNTIEKLDYEEYLGMRTAGQYDRAKLEKINTNWFNELTQPGNVQSHDISIRGGGPAVKYFVSGGFYTEEGIVPTSGFKRFTAKANVDADANKWFKVGMNLTLGYEQSTNATTPDRNSDYSSNIYNPIFRAVLENPYTPLYRKDGSFATLEDGLFWANPIEHLQLNPSKNNISKLIGSTYGEIKFSKELNFKSTLGVDFRDYLESEYISPKSAWGLETKGSVSRYMSRNYRITNTNLFNYKKEFGLHSIDVKLGQETVQNYYENFYAEGEGLPNDVVDVLSSTATPSDVSGNISEYSMLSFFSAANYSYNDRYYFDASFRYDGSSRFGVNNRWAPFWSVAGMWDIKKEDFLVHNRLISRLKYKISYGTTGNWEIGDYTHLALYGSGPTYNDNSGGAPSAPGNPDLTWERRNMLSTGLEFGFWDRIGFELEYYNSVTTDMLFEIPYSYTSGFSGGWSNVGKIRNSGVELTVDWKVINNDEFKWNILANFGYSKNNVEELYEGKDEIINGELITKVGEPLGSFHLNRLVGVNPADGTYVWLDAKGNPTSFFRSSDAVTLSGKSWYAPWTGGLTTKWEYKGFEVSAFFSMMADRWMINNTRYFTENANFATYNQSRKVLDFWKQPGDVVQYPDPLKETTEFDDHLLEDASFVRLKDLTISYNFSERSLKKIKGIEKLNIYGKASNLFTLTKYSGQDPEIDSPYDLGYFPQVKSFSFGIELNF
jgi:TonB-linked SusC/RagA family outer membrane protein